MSLGPSYPAGVDGGDELCDDSVAFYVMCPLARDVQVGNSGRVSFLSRRTLSTAYICLSSRAYLLNF